MLASASTFFVLALSATSALADVFVTAPVATTAFGGGVSATISWTEGNVAPTLKEFGPSKVSIYVGNALQQTSLQLIGDSIDVSTTASVVFTPDGTIGPNSKEYFIRFESLALKDAQGVYPALAFSHKFEMNGMTGEFTPAALAQIEDETAPKVGEDTPTVSATASASATPTVTKAVANANASLSSVKPSASAAAAAADSGASSVAASTVLAFLAAALVAFAL